MHATLNFDMEDIEEHEAFECALIGVELWNALSQLKDHPKFEDVLTENGLSPEKFECICDDDALDEDDLDDEDDEDDNIIVEDDEDDDPDDEE